MINRIGMEAIMGRVQKMVDMREEFAKELNMWHVRVMKGNSKTGQQCWTVSLIPIADCCNCSECRKDCYDIRNVCFQPGVQKTRAINSAIHKYDQARFWQEIDLAIKANFIPELRINVGGDLNDMDFEYVHWLSKENPKCHILFFTKNYYGIANWLDYNTYPENVHPILSAWPGMELYNPHNLPVSHVLFADGTTTAPEFGSYYCGGNCSECFFKEEGCWQLKPGESVIFKEH